MFILQSDCKRVFQHNLQTGKDSPKSDCNVIYYKMVNHQQIGRNDQKSHFSALWLELEKPLLFFSSN